MPVVTITSMGGSTVIEDQHFEDPLTTLELRLHLARREVPPPPQSACFKLLRGEQELALDDTIIGEVGASVALTLVRLVQSKERPTPMTGHIGEDPVRFNIDPDFGALLYNDMEDYSHARHKYVYDSRELWAVESSSRPCWGGDDYDRVLQVILWRLVDSDGTDAGWVQTDSDDTDPYCPYEGGNYCSMGTPPPPAVEAIKRALNEAAALERRLQKESAASERRLQKEADHQKAMTQWPLLFQMHTLEDFEAMNLKQVTTAISQFDLPRYVDRQVFLKDARKALMILSTA